MTHKIKELSVKDKVNTTGGQCKIQLNLILRKQDGRVWSGLIWHRTETNDGIF